MISHNGLIHTLNDYSAFGVVLFFCRAYGGMSVSDGGGGLPALRMIDMTVEGDMSLMTPGLHFRYDWALVSWGGDTGTYADPESFVKGGPTLTTFFGFVLLLFFVDEEIEDPNTTISGQSSARQRNTISMALRRCADDGPTGCWLGSFMIFQRIWTSSAKKPYTFVIFQRGGGVAGHPAPLLDPRMRDR